MYKKRKTAPASQRAGLTALVVGVYVLWACGTNDLLPILGMKDYPIVHWKFVPLGNLAANFYAVFVAYSVLQHELLDIHITMSKAAARLVRLSFVFVIALVLLLAVVDGGAACADGRFVRYRAGGGAGHHQCGVGAVPPALRQRRGSDRAAHPGRPLRVPRPHPGVHRIGAGIRATRSNCSKGWTIC